MKITSKVGKETTRRKASTKATKHSCPALHNAAHLGSMQSYTSGVWQLVPSPGPQPGAHISPTWEGCLCASQEHTASPWVTPQHQSSTATLSMLHRQQPLQTLGCPSQHTAISRQLHKSTTDNQNQKKLFLKATILSLTSSAPSDTQPADSHIYQSQTEHQDSFSSFLK